MDLTNVCYENIKDSFYYGVFGDFKLVIDKNTGCFNATKLCDISGKRFHDWMRSKKMIQYYEQNRGDSRLNYEGLHKQVKKVQRKLGIAVEDRAPQPEDESKRERFVLMKRNNDEYYPYYTIRAQDSYTTRRIKNQKVYFPNLVVLLDFKCSPNSKTLYNRIKETLKAKGVTFDGNNIDLEDTQITEQELIEEMKVINEAKRDV